MPSIDIPSTHTDAQSLSPFLPRVDAPYSKRRRLCFETDEPDSKRCKTVADLAKPVAKHSKHAAENIPPSVPAKLRLRSPSLAPVLQRHPKHDDQPTRRRMPSPQKHTAKTESASVPLRTAGPLPESPPSTKKKSRLALQTIHIKALEHGLRIPVNNTPLGILDKAENIKYVSSSGLPVRPMSARPALATGALRERDAMSVASAGARGTQSAPGTPARPKALSRRNTTGSAARQSFVLEI
ncbi:hypothetical protein GGI15_002530 [Coemansia interrupta]|uniref:Uncharacterized protein n=1 Tax=Coemansia interrupta TaxID=1126814 RepID=A0A9W8HF54_9FUNG|nr:hypothetical protein GGI15_002530 [Coemansia interrupta]